MSVTTTLLLYVLTALTELAGCYLPYLWLKQGKSSGLLIPAILCLILFVWLLTLHPDAAGRTYASYGGVYIAVALAWLWIVEGIKPSSWDILGGLIVLIGVLVIICSPRG